MSNTIGLQIDVDYKGQAAFRQVQGDVDRVSQVMRTKGSAAAGVYRDATGRLRNELGRYVGASGRASKATQTFSNQASRAVLPIKSLISAAAAYAAVRLGQTIFNQSESMRGLELAFEAAAGGVKEGAGEFEFARQQAERLGIDLDVTAGSYKGMVAASIASGKSLEFAREVFLGVAESGRAMALSNEDIKGTMLAVQQIISKGTVNAEELRQQLGERFPVAVGIMAKALGVSTGELSKMMEQGQITSDALLPFARKLREEYGDKLADAIALPSAELSRLGNDAKELATDIGEGGLSAAVTIVTKSLRTLFDVAAKENLGEKIGGAMKLIAENAATFISTYGPGMVKVIGQIAGAIKDNFTPALLLARDYVRTLHAAFQFVAGGILNAVADIIGAFNKIALKAADIAAAVGMDGVAAKIRSVSVSVEETRRTLETMGDAAFESFDRWLTGKKQADDGQKDLTKTVKLTAEEVRKLGEDALVMNGKIVDAGRKVAESVDTWKSRLVQVNGVWTTVGGTAQAASNTVQSSVSSASKSTDTSFKKIETDGKSAAKGVADAFDKAGKGMVKSMADAADKVEKNFGKIRQEARKQEIDKIQENSLMNQKMAPIDTAFADDLPGLQEQLQDAIRAKGDIWRVGAGIKGYYDFAHKESDKIIAEIQGRIDALKQQEAEQQASRSDNDRVITTTSTGSSTTGTGRGGRSQPTGVGSSSMGFTGLGGGSGGGGRDSLVLGKDSGRSTTINNPQFIVDIRGVDEQMLNSRNLVQQLLPELRRAVAQGELEHPSR